MKVFIGWSGSLSARLGEALRNWLPKVIQSVNPYYTPMDIDMGARWESEIAQELNESKLGILCVTPDNTKSDWLHFEAGALSNRLDKARVCPILFGVKTTDLTGPLRQFQAAPFGMDGVRKLIHDINDCQDGGLQQKQLNEVFDKWWPDLESEIKEILDDASSPPKPIRTEKEMIEEILQLTRRLDIARMPVSPTLVMDLLNAYIELHDMQVDKRGGYQETLDSLKEMQEPIMSIIRYQRGRLPKRGIELFHRLGTLSYEVEPDDAEERDDDIPPPQDDDIPF